MRCEHCVPKKIKGIYHVTGNQPEILCLHENVLTIRNLANLFENHGKILRITAELDKNNELIGASRIKFSNKAEAVAAVKAITILLNKTTKIKRDIDVVIEECYSLNQETGPERIMQQSYTKLSTERTIPLKSMHQNIGKIGKNVPVEIMRKTYEKENAVRKVPPKCLNETFDVDCCAEEKCTLTTGIRKPRVNGFLERLKERKNLEKKCDGSIALKKTVKMFEGKGKSVSNKVVKVVKSKEDDNNNNEKKTFESKEKSESNEIVEVKSEEDNNNNEKKTIKMSEGKGKSESIEVVMEKSEEENNNNEKKEIKMSEGKGKSESNKTTVKSKDGNNNVKKETSAVLRNQNAKNKKNLANIKTIVKSDVKKTLNRLASMKIK